MDRWKFASSCWVVRAERPPPGCMGVGGASPRSHNLIPRARLYACRSFAWVSFLLGSPPLLVLASSDFYLLTSFPLNNRIGCEKLDERLWHALPFANLFWLWVQLLRVIAGRFWEGVVLKLESLKRFEIFVDAYFKTLLTVSWSILRVSVYLRRYSSHFHSKRTLLVSTRTHPRSLLNGVLSPHSTL